MYESARPTLARPYEATMRLESETAPAGTLWIRYFRFGAVLFARNGVEIVASRLAANLSPNRADTISGAVARRLGCLATRTAALPGRRPWHQLLGRNGSKAFLSQCPANHAGRLSPLLAIRPPRWPEARRNHGSNGGRPIEYIATDVGIRLIRPRGIMIGPISHSWCDRMHRDPACRSCHQ
jgi:hypothetical protein